MKTTIVINRHKVKANAKNGTNLPVISVKQGRTTRYCHSVRMSGPSTIIYNPDKPLKCGARVFCVTTAPVLLFTNNKT